MKDVQKIILRMEELSKRLGLSLNLSCKIQDLFVSINNSKSENEADLIWKTEMGDLSPAELDPWNKTSISKLAKRAEKNEDDLLFYFCEIAQEVFFLAPKKQEECNENKFFLPFCELCHRSKSTKRYCHVHKNPDSRRSAERKMASYVKNNNITIPRYGLTSQKRLEHGRIKAYEDAYKKRFNKKLKKMTMPVILKYEPKSLHWKKIIYQYTKKVEKPSLGSIKNIIDFVKKYLPEADSIIKKIDDLDYLDDASFEKKLSSALDEPVNINHQSIFGVLIRYQLSADIFKNKRPGPTKKSNDEIKSKFREAKNKSELSRNLGISRQRLYKIVN